VPNHIFGNLKNTVPLEKICLLFTFVMTLDNTYIRKIGSRSRVGAGSEPHHFSGARAVTQLLINLIFGQCEPKFRNCYQQHIFLKIKAGAVYRFRNITMVQGHLMVHRHEIMCGCKKGNRSINYTLKMNQHHLKNPNITLKAVRRPSFASSK
jgi:hypothetical protein